MAVSGGGNTYVYSSYTHLSSNREDLVDWIANIDPSETPLLISLGRVQSRDVIHQWQTDVLRGRNTRGIPEGQDWAAPVTVGPVRVTNTCEIFGQDLAVTESQRAVNPAGFADTYAYEMEKGTKSSMVDIEVSLMNDGTPTTGASATGRVASSLEEFITTNVTLSTALATPGATVGAAGLFSAKDINVLLQRIWATGGNTDLIVCNGAYKMQIRALSQVNGNRNILAEQKKLVVAVDIYDSDFGLVPIQLNRWSPVSTNSSTATTTAGSGDVTGRIWFLQRSMVNTAWLRPLGHRYMGVRGDSTVGQLRAEMCIEVKNEKALGVMKGVNNFSANSV